MIIHYINHNFADWDSQTKHMTRIEKSIFLDLRTMYFGNAKKSNGNIDGNDFDLLCYRLSCKTDEEITALKTLLKDKFIKVGKVYRNADWDRQIKNLEWWYQKQGNVGNESGNVGNVGGNESGNAMSNAERTAKAKAERKNIVNALSNIGIEFDKNAPIATLRALLAANQSNVEVTETVTHGNGNGNADGNVGNADGNESGNVGNAEIRANNHKPITNNHKPINISFEEFWNAYDKKRGDKTKIEAKWAKLSDADRLAIMQHVPQYKASQPDKQYRKDPETYLNNKSWHDEIIPRTQPKAYASANDPLAVNAKFRPSDTGMIASNTVFEADADGNFIARPIQSENQSAGHEVW